MVYKKIKENIPSLSSLLLTGLALGACKDDPKAPAPTPPVEPTPNVPGGGNVAEKVKNLASALSVATDPFVRKMMIKLVELLPPHLLHTAGLRVLTEEELNKEGKDMQEICHNFFKEIANSPAFPEEDRECLKPLTKISFSAGSPLLNIVTGSVANKSAHARAINKIAEARKKVNTQAVECKSIVTASIWNPAEIAQYGARVSALKKETMKQGEVDFFVKTQQFSDPKHKTDFPKGKQLIKVIKDQDNNPSVRRALEQNLGEVWVYMKSKNASCWENRVSGEFDHDKHKLGRKGSGASAQWLIGGTTKMWGIDPLNDCVPLVGGNGNPQFYHIPGLTHVGGNEDFMNVTDHANIAHAIKTDDAPQPEAIKRTTNINAATLIFDVLAKGVGPGHFINLTPAASGKVVEVSTEDKELKAWVDASDDSDKFAEFIGKHIQNNTELGRIFPIPDVKDILNELNLSGYQSGIANGPRANANVPHADIEQDTPSAELCQAILKLYDPLYNVGTATHANILARINRLARLHKGALIANGHDDYKNLTDLNLKQRVAACLASGVADGGKLRNAVLSDGDNSARELINQLEEFIEKEALKDFIVIRKDGKFKTTQLLGRLRGAFQELAKILYSGKKGDGVITYGDIAAHANGFSIEQIGSSLKKDFDTLEHIAGAPTLLQNILLNHKGGKGTVNYANLLNLELASSGTDALDAIRLDFQRKSEIEKNKSEEESKSTPTTQKSGTTAGG